MMEQFKKQWAQMSSLDKALYSCIIFCTLGAFVLLGISGMIELEQGPLYSLLLMGIAALLQAVKIWKTGKFFSIFLGLFAAVFLFLGIAGLA